MWFSRLTSNYLQEILNYLVYPIPLGPETVRISQLAATTPYKLVSLT